MNKLSLLIVLLFNFYCFSQDLPEIIPPSPEATSLAKFTEVPVSHYTGLPTISIPIYTISSGGLDIPVSLSYHARGVRVAEIASRVGIGWSLNAGGAITRQIRGKADEGQYGYLTGNFYETFENNSNTRMSVYTDVGNDEVDLVPDQFSFSFLGYSGKFIFDQKTGLPLVQGYSDLEVKKITFNRWLITTDSGYKFYFGNPQDTTEVSRVAIDKDVSIFNYMHDNNIHAPTIGTTNSSTWHLIDIVTPSGEIIKFNYEEENPIFFRRSYDKKEDNTGETSYFSKINGSQYQLKEILFDNGDGKVIFTEATTGRQDLYDGYALETIEIKGKNNSFINKYKFYYSYSTDSQSDNVLNYLKNSAKYNSTVYANDYAKKRMFLDAVKKVLPDNSEEHYYTIDYTDKNSLPNRFSNAQDNWGYFNDKDNGQFLTFYNYDPNNPVNREVDTVKAQIGLIDKITYPTGGHAKYTFEANRANPPFYFNDLYFKNTNPTATVTNHASMLMGGGIADGIYEEEFEIVDTPVGSLRSHISFFGNYGQCSSTQNDAGCKYQVRIEGINGTSYSSDLYIGVNNDAPLPSAAGEYKIKVIASGVSSDPSSGFSVALSWNEQSVTNPELIYSGGNRIKEIELNSTDNGKIIKSYEYTRPDGQSSGLIFSLPSYYYKNEQFSVDGHVITAEQYGARPGSPYTYEQGNHTGYSYVIEYIDSENEKGKGGKTEYSFTAMQDDGNFYKPPYTLPVDNEWLRGKPIQIKHFSKNNGVYSLVKQDNFTYKYADELLHFYVTLFPTGGAGVLDYRKDNLRFNIPLIVFKLNDINPPVPDYDAYKVYNLNGGVQKLHSKREKLFYDSHEVLNVTDYYYDYDKHYQVKKTKVVDSKGKVLLNETIYPQDETNSDPLESKLIDQHRFDPLETYSYEDLDDDGIGDPSELLSQQKTIYRNWGANSNPNLDYSEDIVLPEFVQTLKGEYNSSTNPLESRITYHEYDDHGNPLEVSKVDGTHIAYIWGHNKQYPVAKIENATYSQIEGLAYFGTDFDLGSSGLSTSQENSLRTNLSNAMVTTYTYEHLVGVTSVADPKGYTTFYEYDNHNRLWQVKDKNGKILSQNEYRYKN